MDAKETLQGPPLKKPAEFWLTLIRSALGQCPNCGKGRLFRSYLKPVGACAVCGEEFGHIRSDDGPAWLTILVVGHILAPILLEVVPDLMWPEWVIVSAVLAFTFILCLLILPRAKGIFVGLIWRSGCIGSEK